MDRPYDLILYGATGYLGSLVAQYLWAHSSQNLRWAVAGRNGARLAALVESFGPPQSHRKSPDVLVVTLGGDDLGRMASQTRVLLNTVGPFCKYGTPIVEACIEHSTAYVDSTGEHIWMQQLTVHLHERAVTNKAIIIPQCAVESSPPDLMTLLLARQLRRPLGPTIFTIQHSWVGYSGGTIESILACLETYSIRQMMAASQPRATCIPDAGPHEPHSQLLPVRRDRILGHLTFNPSAMADKAVVMRTWSLKQQFSNSSEQFGKRFSFQGYTTASNRFQAWSTFLVASITIPCILLFPPLRWLLRWLSPKPGTGPQLNTGVKHYVEWKATVAADGDDVSEPSVVGVMRLNMDLYSASAILVVEAALTLLEVLEGNDEDLLVKKLAGGILTPASLGIRYVERLGDAGLEWKVTEVGKNNKQ